MCLCCFVLQAPGHLSSDSDWQRLEVFLNFCRLLVRSYCTESPSAIVVRCFFLYFVLYFFGCAESESVAARRSCSSDKQHPPTKAVIRGRYTRIRIVINAYKIRFSSIHALCPQRSPPPRASPHGLVLSVSSSANSSAIALARNNAYTPATGNCPTSFCFCVFFFGPCFSHSVATSSQKLSFLLPFPTSPLPVNDTNQPDKTAKTRSKLLLTTATY